MATLTAYKATNNSFHSFYATPPHTYTVGGSVGTAGTPITSALYLFDDEAYARDWGAKAEASKGGGLKILEVTFDDVADRPDTGGVSAYWV